MVNYKNATNKNVGITATTVLTVPTNEAYTVMGITVANTIATTVYIDITVYDSEKNHEVYLIKHGKIPSSMTMVPLSFDEQTLVLDAGDQLKIKSSAENSVDVIASYLTITP